MTEQERNFSQSLIDQRLDFLRELAGRHPEIREKLNEILLELGDILFTLNAENSSQQSVRSKLEAIAFLIENVRTEGSYTGEIPSPETVGLPLVQSVIAGVQARIKRTQESKNNNGGRPRPAWMKRG